MSLREIPRPDWPAFLERFSREHRAWLASVERVRPGAARRVEVRERPLRSVTADTGIQIQFQQLSEAVRVDAPTRLRVDETKTGAAQALEIDGESGERVTLRFRVTAPPEALDGVAPGEL